MDIASCRSQNLRVMEGLSCTGWITQTVLHTARFPQQIDGPRFTPCGLSQAQLSTGAHLGKTPMGKLRLRERVEQDLIPKPLTLRQKTTASSPNHRDTVKPRK